MRRTRTMAVAALVVMAVLLLAAPVAFALQMRDGGFEPHRAVLAVAGPTIVVQELADRANELPGEAFDARAVDSETVARDSIRDGTAAVAVLVDFREPHDTLLVSTTAAPELVVQYRAPLEAISTGFGRALDMETIEPTAGDQVGRRSPYVVTFIAVCVGVGLAVLVSLWLGPTTATAVRGAVRLAGLAVAGAITGLGVAASTPGHGLLMRALATALLVTVVAWLIVALESVLGLWGLVLAPAALLGLCAPLLTYVEPAALPSPWRWLLPWTPHGAALDLHRDLFFFETSSLRAWSLLVTWAAIAVLTLVLARRNRPV